MKFPRKNLRRLHPLPHRNRLLNNRPKKLRPSKLSRKKIKPHLMKFKQKKKLGEVNLQMAKISKNDLLKAVEEMSVLELSDVIKALRELVPTLGLKEAKDLVDTAPKEVMTQVNKKTADEAKEKLTAAGATVELK